MHRPDARTLRVDRLVMFGPIVSVVLTTAAASTCTLQAGPGWIIAIVMAGAPAQLYRRSGPAAGAANGPSKGWRHPTSCRRATSTLDRAAIILVAMVIFPFFTSKYLLALVIPQPDPRAARAGTQTSADQPRQAARPRQ